MNNDDTSYDRKEKKLGLGLSDPAAVWERRTKEGEYNKIKTLEGVDFTEEQCDVSPYVVEKLGDYALDLLKKGRRGNNRKNVFFPSAENDSAGIHKKGNELSTISNRTDGYVYIESSDLSAIDESQNKFAPKSVDDTKNLFNKIGKDAPPRGDKTKTSEFETFSQKLSKISQAQKSNKPGQFGDYQSIQDLSDSDKSGLVSSAIKLLNDNNMFSPVDTNVFVKNGSKDEDEAIEGLFSIQRELGKFIIPGNANDSLTNSASGTKVKTSDMSAIAMSLLARATGDMKSAGGLVNALSLQTSIVEDALADISQQLGLSGIDISQLQLNGIVATDERRRKIIEGASGNSNFIATDSTKNIYQRGMKKDGKFVVESYNSVSYGQLNNFMEPFGDGFLTSIGMLTIATTSIATVIGLGLIVESIAQAGFGSDATGDRIDPYSPETMTFGRHSKFSETATITDFLIRDLLRIPKTDYDFGDCLGAGLSLMVGFPGSFITRSEVSFGISDSIQLQNFAINLLTSPGYYANYMRQIILSGQEITASFAKLSGSNAISATEQFFASIQDLASSKAWQFMMIAASIGDANLKSIFGQPGISDFDKYYKTNNIFPQSTIKIENRDSNSGPPLLLNLKDFQGIARLRSNASRWGGSSKNTLSLSTFIASNVYDPRLSGHLNPMRSIVADRKNVQIMEDALEAEYVPFYFHDLRNHEVISLPAFIISFDESYAVNYNTINGYGRQDGVKLHSNTERSINFIFKVVAFNEQDFDNMYYTINKFVSMCYPQYSTGISRSFNDGKNQFVFDQPFSQVPAASPLIRIRLGDLFKSNYSNMGLRSLFGVNTDRFKIGTNDSDTVSHPGEEYRKQLITEYTRILQENTNKQVSEDTIKYYRIDGGRGFVFEYSDTVAEQIGNVLGSIVSASPDGGTFFIPDGYVLRPQLNSAGPILGSMIVENNTVSGPFQLYTFTQNQVNESTTIQLKNIPLSYFIPDTSDIGSYMSDSIPNRYQGIIEKEAINKLASLGIQDSTDSSNFNDNTERFFNPATNSIVRSFESTQGKGLAGFITSLSMNYGDAPWETKLGSIAPKYVDITMAFSPIHDLPVGLDSDGRLRSPSHPIGKIAGSGFGSVYNDSSTDFQEFHKNIDNLSRTSR